MNFKKVAILTSMTSWFVPYAKQFIKILKKRRISAKLFFDYENISEEFEIVFILSYFKIIPKDFLLKLKHNLIVHESDLPEGKGWAPLFWQILEAKNEIPIVLIEASERVDGGDIFIKDSILYEGHELYDEIREKQAKKTMDLCLRYIERYEIIKPKKQIGKGTIYKKRNAFDSELDIKKTIEEQFNLLRIVNNKDFPAFFYHKDQKYIIKIYKAGK